MEITSTLSPDDEYILGRTSAEYQRLRQQAMLWEFATQRVLSRLGLREGMSCADIGSGPGETMRLMGELVGASGYVLGVDMDNIIGQESLIMLKTANPARYEFLHANLLELDELTQGPFDLVLARLTLYHMKNPADLLRKMSRWVKPGGYVVVQDYYNDGAAPSAPFPEFQHYKDVFYGVCRAAGLDPNIGVRLPDLFIEAGLGFPDDTDVAGRLVSFAQAKLMLKAVYTSVLQPALQLKLTTPERAQAYADELDRVEQTGQVTAGLWPLMISAWKKM
ncbi:SAM-dependent methyltransferase [Spirosoma lacussanchae]|uniref:class I SAM-dependent methyltransferase n=1 Tax=Spirosoma lacussanchae TaxID=1884249 RepID=UPI001107F1FE|nr:class I SAM-dependent methyltransferase [Spirosoma lacussanchae]